MILIPLLLLACAGLQSALSSVSINGAMAETNPSFAQPLHVLSCLDVPRVPAHLLPSVYLDNVPWDGPRGRFLSGPMVVDSLGAGYCFVHVSSAGVVMGWFEGELGRAELRGMSEGVLGMFPADPPEAIIANPCMVPTTPVHAQPSIRTGISSGLASVCGVRPLRLAVETDVQFSQRFADVESAAAWLSLGLLQAQHALVRDLRVALEVPYLGLHGFEDPWVASDAGGGAEDLLEEFRTLWPGLAPLSTHLSHFVSGTGNGLSLAGQGGVCRPSEAFAVHTMRLDMLGRPDGQAFATALLHGLGHNLGARHAESYCPPLDLCSPAPNGSGCGWTRDCGSPGFVMGTCHLCPGGLDRVALGFHPVNVQAMESLLGPCLPHRLPVRANAPETRAPGEEWIITMETGLAQLQAPILRYWGEAGSGELSMATVSPGVYRVHVPPGECGQWVRASISMETRDCGSVTWPEPGLGAPLENQSMALQRILVDDMSSNRGWISLQDGAMSGYWTRGIPIADPGWPIAPAQDSGGDGWCFLTGNYWGNSDVDGGRVEVISPPIPVVRAPLQIEFDYFLGLVNENGEDRLTLQMSWDGIGGPWTSVWRSGFDTGRQWQRVVLDEDYLARWPRNLPANLHLRFLARDGSPPSVVEAAIDGVVVSAGACP